MAVLSTAVSRCSPSPTAPVSRTFTSIAAIVGVENATKTKIVKLCRTAWYNRSMTVLRALFDGRVIVPDERVDLPEGRSFEVHVREVPNPVATAGTNTPE